MKKTIISLTTALVFATATMFAQRSTLEIPASASIELDYANFEMYQLTLKNKSGKELGIKVLNKKTNDFVRGFGLGPLGKVKVMVEQTSKIVFTNTNATVAKLAVEVAEMDAKKVVDSNQGLVSFTLVNSTNESIPLIIPNVMNPNLSPNSKSGVDLKIGQELLFKNKGKRYVLFTVDETITEGQQIDVYEVLKARKEALALK